MYSNQEEVKLSQKTVSTTTFDAPEINLVHTAVKQLENIMRYKNICYF